MLFDTSTGKFNDLNQRSQKNQKRQADPMTHLNPDNFSIGTALLTGKLKTGVQKQKLFDYGHYQQDLDNMKDYGGRKIEDLSPAELQRFANQVGGGANTGGARDIFRRLTEDSASMRQENLRKQLTSQSQDFRKNLGQTADEQYGLLKSETEASLREGLKKTRRNYNERGLLYSGLRQGGESELKGAAASGLASGRAEINQGLEETAQGFERQAAAVGLESYKEAQQRAEELYSSQLESTLMRRRAAQSLGAGVGYAAGSYYGGGGSSYGAQSGQYSQGAGLLGQQTMAQQYPGWLEQRNMRGAG